MKQIKYINKKMVIVINRFSVEISGGTAITNDNIRNGQSLGFVERIYSNTMFGESIYPDIFHQAAAYMYYIIKNHVFHDGNKRTGLATAITFLQWNDIYFQPFDEDSVFDFVISVASSTQDADEMIAQIAAWLKSMCK